MLQIIGPKDTAEYAAAHQLAQRITQVWDDLVEHPQHQLVIVAAAKCYGQPVCDIDLLVFFHTPSPIILLPTTADTQPIALASFCLAIEVKDHPPEHVRFVGATVEVRYHNRWHNVSEQSYRQRFAVRGYLESQAIPAPYVVNLIWLRNVADYDLPPPPHNILGKQSSWDTMLRQVTLLTKPYWHRSTQTLRIHSLGDIPAAMHAFRSIRKPQSTTLEAIKITGMVRQTEKSGTIPAYVEKLGTQLLVFQGRGGTGKTATLLKLAHMLYQYRHARVLILTYNRVLSADIRRLLALMDIADGVAQQSIAVQTVHAFLYQVMKGFGILPQPCQDFLENYSAYKRQLEHLLETHHPHIADLIHEHTTAFSWEFIGIDEAQDWPIDERNILYALYDYRHFIIADGGDQLIRGYQKCNWVEPVPTSERQIVTLSKSLRLKPQVCAFVNTFAAEVGLTDWQVEPFGKEPTGRVIVFQGAYTKTADFHTALLQSHTDQGRALMDMLFCVPPRLVRRDPNGRTQSVVARILETWGYASWDATNPDMMQQYPIDHEQIRIVQYDSCRGLEGWTVVHLEFDELYTYKRNSYAPTPDEQQELWYDQDTAADQYALRWLMIPLTRGIHTLVIHLTPTISQHHPILVALRKVHTQYPHLITWHQDGAEHA
jgi:hypothetical protein